MKHFVWLLLAFATIGTNAQNIFPATGNAGIGTNAPDAAALLELRSTNKGFLPPRLSVAQRDAIVNPPKGLIIFQTNNTQGLYIFNGITWAQITPQRATQTLNNLTAPTAVNQHLLPGIDSSADLGSNTKQWRDLYTAGIMQNEQLKGKGFRPLFADSIGNIVDNITLPFSSKSDTSSQAIPDNSCVGITRTITIAGAVPSISGSNVNLRLNISHPQVGDLSIFLTSPDGKTLCIVNTNDNHISGANMTNTIIREVESGPLSTGVAPYTGAFLSDGNLTSFICGSITPNISSFFGLGISFNPNGVWTLKVFDTKPNNSGTLLNWTIDIGTQEPTQGVWSLSGNENTNSLNFIGTLDNQPLRFKVNNNTAATIGTSGNFGIGNSFPSARLHVTGSASGGNNTTPLMILDNGENNTLLNLKAASNRESTIVFGNDVNDSATSTIVYNAINNPLGLHLRTTGTNRLSIDNLGRVGINTMPTSSDAVFTVKGFTNTAGNAFIIKNFAGSPLFTARDDGRFSMNTPISSSTTFAIKSLGSTFNNALNIVNSSNTSILNLRDDGVLSLSSGGPKLRVGNTSGDGIRIGSFESIIDSGSSFLTVNAKFAPSFDNDVSSTLGDATHRWRAVFATNGTINTSDARDKENIQPIEYGMETIMKLKPVSFKWKNSFEKNTKLGLIAQDLQKVIPEVVVDKEWVSNEENNNKTQQPAARLGVYYSDIIPVLIKGMQEQQNENDKLKLQVTALEKRLANLEQAIMASQGKTTVTVAKP